MSVREEDRQKNGCPSRGLALAAAAIGVGVGTALYYFFSKRQENPHSEGSTSDWNCERAPTLSEDQQLASLRQEAFRERSWTLEECSICFDVMLRTQEVTSLSCAHNFHTECIMPWLQEKQTCPNCRKVAE